MSDEGEKSCPLCAEDMDLTDQQLKPCKCGYEICVWCWHHIMDMAEKDETEGRCPACRTPYNKEKIVGTTAKCERLVSEMSVEKKLKSQKGKSKTLEGRKQLGSVRVVQRNLVYVVGLPLDFADEDLLQRRDYFGQYGKVMKVSISRTAAGAIQQFANSTCSVYITYSKEEEAVRCIQSVHGFILDDRPLRACFGTTKYCHAWLRNVACTNPDCLYLHEVGSQEDSFTKDEIISAYTRSRVQQITSSSNTMQRRSGNVLPPPADEYCNNTSASSGKPVTKTSITINQNSASVARVSPPNSSSGRSAALPAGASWGTRASSNQTLPTSTPCFNASLKQRPDSCNGPVTSSTTVASANPVSSLQSDSGKKLVPDEESINSQHNSKLETFESTKNDTNTDLRFTVSESSVSPVHPANLSINRQPHSPPTNKPAPNTVISNFSITTSGPALDKDYTDDRDGNMENVCSDILSMSIHENQQLQNGNVEHINEPETCQTSEKATNTTEEISVANTQKSDFRLGMSIQVPQVDMHEMEDDLLSFHNQRSKDPEISINRVSDFSHAFHLANHSPQLNNLDKQIVDRNNTLLVSASNFPSRRPQAIHNIPEGDGVGYSNFFPSKEKMSLLGRYEGEVGTGTAEMGESSMISNILSLDLDPWDESLTSPQNMDKLLGETDKRQGSFGAPGPRRAQNSSQSRFSFAREGESTGQVSDFGQSIDYFGQAFKQEAGGHDFSRSNSFHHERFGCNSFPIFSGTETDTFPSGHSHISSNKLSVSRSQISAPPGFSAPSRAAPPGFTSHERRDQFFETLSGNHMFDASSLLRNQYQTPTPSSGNAFSNGDIEFMDPAILAVGKGTLPGGMNGPSFDTRSNFSPQLSTYEEARFQSFLQRSNLPHQNQRFTDLGDNFSTLGNGYGIPSRVMEQTLSNNISPFSHFTLPQSRSGITSNGQWDRWNEAQNGNNNLGMAELLRNERLGFNKFYGGYEDSKIRMPNSGNLYNGTYGI
ncbi:hypothetical protein BUALT_Bualt02G0052900 [Buddleja alternifolia]|uniref:CCR4-NOT transcription complex subunit 4 n=1 Tax=Buddleja alternifolia TaxID=168488 RepID=A0AAV6XXK1_9LAMI|nr:hypothetical protein BUALT_Bualt02G0052900 [Buddleja alternifolia]